MFSKILVPLDGSPEAEAAIEPAKAIAEKFGSTVVLLEVTAGYGRVVAATAAETFGAAGSVAAMAEAEKAAEGKASAYLDNLRTERGTPLWQALVAEGDSSSVIVDQARANKADLIVLATHQRTGFKRLFLGSVAEDVVRHAQAPVLIVHRED
jgi:nucleotide-binding universal stress UspA family protein